MNIINTDDLMRFGLMGTSSVLHRVTIVLEDLRFSIAVFLDPDPDVVVKVSIIQDVIMKIQIMKKS